MNKRAKQTLLTLLGLFSAVRGYNILMVCLAQYFIAIFILSKNTSVYEVITDANLFALIVATALSVAGGYIINGFYDKAKDLINRPLKTMIDHLVGQHIKLSLYFLLNFLAIVVASYVSFKAVIFFSGFIFLLWIYSHRIKKILFWGNFLSASLAIIPFFAVFIYYKNMKITLFFQAAMLFFFILIKDLIKDLGNLKGDLAHNYQTIPVKYGEFYAKMIISLIIFINISLIFITLRYFSAGYMNFYLIFTIFYLVFLLFSLWIVKNRSFYVLFHFSLKIILILGIIGVANNFFVFIRNYLIIN